MKLKPLYTSGYRGCNRKAKEYFLLFYLCETDGIDPLSYELIWCRNTEATESDLIVDEII